MGSASVKAQSMCGGVGKGEGEGREEGGWLVGPSAGLRLRGSRSVPAPGTWDAGTRGFDTEFHRKLNQLQSLIKDPRFLIKLCLIKW